MLLVPTLYYHNFTNLVLHITPIRQLIISGVKGVSKGVNLVSDPIVMNGGILS